MMYNKKNAFTVECLSAIGEVYYIDRTVKINLIKAFNMILENNRDVNLNCDFFVKTKLEYLVDRLKIIKESRVNMFDAQNCKIEKKEIRLA